MHIVVRVKFALLHSEAAHVECTSSIALDEKTMKQFSWKNCLKVIRNKRRLRCGCGVIKHGRRGEIRGLELFMSSNLIKLAPKHFLIFLICLDNPIYAKKPWRRDENLFRFRFTWNEIKVSLPLNPLLEKSFVSLLFDITNGKACSTICLSGIQTLFQRKNLKKDEGCTNLREIR